jgi:hypothetical protein
LVDHRFGFLVHAFILANYALFIDQGNDRHALLSGAGLNSR